MDERRVVPDSRHLISDTGEIEWDRRERGKGVVTINAPKARAVIGYTGGRDITLGGATFTRASSPTPDWSTLCISLVEGESLTKPGRALLIATGSAENTHMRWKDAQRSSVGRQWGEAPSRVEVIPAVVKLPGQPAALEVWTLNEKGRHATKLSTTAVEGGSSSKLGHPATLWYEIVTR